MPYKRKVSPIWWVSYTDANGKRVRRSTETTDRKEAEALKAKWKLEAFKVKQWDATPEVSFEDLMVAYLNATALKRSHERDLHATKRLREVFAGRSMHQLKGLDIESYKRHRCAQGARPATVNKELGLLSTAITFANRLNDWNLQNPVKGKKLAEPEGRLRWLSHSEARKLIEAASLEPTAPHLPDFILLALNTGCRRGELLGLEWARVDLDTRLIYLEAIHQKNGRRGSVPLNEEAHRALVERTYFRAKHCPQSPWVFCDTEGNRIQSIKRSFGTACRRAGIEDFHIHDLRHTCAAWLVQAGVPLIQVRDLLRHSTVEMTERYAHLSPDNVRTAVAALNGWSRFGHASVVGTA